MSLHPSAGKPADRSTLVSVPRLVSAYYVQHPDPADPAQRVAFGTSGHRGRAMAGSFNEAHILAIAQAVCEHRRQRGIDGPVFVGMDTHALSEPAFMSVLEVLAAHGLEVRIDAERGYTPTPVISHAILTHNRGRQGGRADGIVITPSHNPPEDGGIKYNPPHGGPADAETTTWIEQRANALLAQGNQGVQRVRFETALRRPTTRKHDYVTPYVADLVEVLDMEAIRSAGLRIGVDPLGGSSIGYWAPIAERYGLAIEVVRDAVDPTFGFMPVDRDGKIRMDCSSRHAMAQLIELRDRFDVAFGNDPDADRHGIVTRQAGLLDPNHYLAVAVRYLFGDRTGWPSGAAVGKTVVSSSMLDRVARDLKRPLAEVPVGFKWFVEGLLEAQYGFGGEESAGASFLRKDGRVWTTDKDGILLSLLAAEVTAKTGRDPGELYQTLTERFGTPIYERLDAPATPAQKAALQRLSPDQVRTDALAGEPIVTKLTRAPANGASLGGLKVVTENGWFAARPSGTEDVYKIYTESFLGREHLLRIQEEARGLVDAVLAGS